VERLRAITDAYQELAAVIIQTSFRRQAAYERYKRRRAKLFLLHQSPKLIAKLKAFGVRDRYRQVRVIKKLQSMGIVKVKWQTFQVSNVCRCCNVNVVPFCSHLAHNLLTVWDMNVSVYVALLSLLFLIFKIHFGRDVI
jgi:hypothetical protein